MAEKPQLRIADQDHFSDDDPFAELTRIMGFDPRVPVQREPEAAAGEPEGSAAQNAADDFGIDLEKELMGEFAAEDTGDANLHSVEPADEYQPEEPSYVGESAAYEVAAEPAAAVDETVAPAEFEPVVDFEPATPESSADEAHDFDSAFASSMEHELSLDGDWVAAEEASIEAEPVYFEGTEDQVEPAAGEDRPVAEYQPADYPDSNLQADAYQEPQPVYESAQEEFAPEGNWVEADDSHASGQADELADEFDAALAEVDMDFTAIPLGSAGRSEADLDAELQLQLQQDAAEEAAPVADAGPSLEDELNALLGNMSGREEHQAAPVVMEDYAPSVDVEAEAEVQDEQGGDVDMALAADEFVAAMPAAMEAPAHETPVDRSYARSNYRDEDLAYTTPVSDIAHVEGRAAESADADIDLGFDDEAFDAAFASSIENEQPDYDGEPVAADEQETTAGADADPYADLASLTAQFVPTGPVSSWREQSPLPDQYAVQYGEADYASAGDDQGATTAYDDIPDIETVEVPEQAVALSDDLDIPEVVYEEEPTPSPAYDDIDAEFANLLNDMNSPEPTSAAPSNDAANEAITSDTHAEERADYAADFAYPAAAAAGAVAAGAMGAAAAYGQRQPMASQGNDFDGQDFAAETTHAGYRQPISDDLDYDPDFDEEMALPAMEQERQRPQRRGMLIAAIVGGVAIIGGIGAFALSGGGADSQTPAVVKADDGPIKVRPENPGGTKVPNQDNQVYDAVSRTAGAAAPQPQQEKLVTSAEEPVDMASQEPEPSEPELAQGVEADAPAPMAKSEDRIEQLLDEGGAGADSSVPVVAPRKVRTMVVKADGTLVPREEPAPAVAAAQDMDTTASETMIEPTLSSESTAAVPAAPAETAAAPADAEPVPAEAGAAPKVAQPQQSSTTPNSVAVAPTRPSDQPVDVVGEVKADKVAALAPAAAGGGWSMQIASQPSEAAAQSSYQDLLRRYGSVLNGHQANIVKAEIAGKGTFWRVRVPAETRNDAIKLCESYKAAGGNCFVSK
ncbi:hypothetical protein EET67_06260 [Pseudaminobacter arsenicus]|uniref:SPOR domain-containing protein n=1 Tax=Borborobacter arsenicus TaxID=1851146 RepID=A0A432V940_9HYPH|nr:SPOR domain-containing protein [Pseudaminobacter arsenicus]RUM98702.1 hypothetical protein EET67_06260 [Pseudaminobacter arsenicus]